MASIGCTQSTAPAPVASLRLYRTADGRIFDRPEQADDHSADRDDRGLDMLTALVTSVRPMGHTSRRRTPRNARVPLTCGFGRTP